MTLYIERGRCRYEYTHYREAMTPLRARFPFAATVMYRICIL